MTGTVTEVDDARGYVHLVENETNAKVVLASKGREKGWINRLIANENRQLLPGARIAVYGVEKSGKSPEFYTAEHGVVVAAPSVESDVHLLPAILNIKTAKDKQSRYIQAQVLDAKPLRIESFPRMKETVIAALDSRRGPGFDGRRGFMLRAVTRNAAGEYLARSHSFWGREGADPERIWNYHRTAVNPRGKNSLERFVESVRPTLTKDKNAWLEVVGFTGTFVQASPKYLDQACSRPNFSHRIEGGRTVDAFSLAALVTTDQGGKRTIARAQPLPKAKVTNHQHGLIGSNLPGSTMKTALPINTQAAAGAYLDAPTQKTPGQTAGVRPAAPSSAQPAAQPPAARQFPLSIADIHNSRTGIVDSFSVKGPSTILAQHRDRIMAASSKTHPIELPGDGGFNFPVNVRSEVCASLSDLAGTSPVYIEQFTTREGKVLVAKGRIKEPAIYEKLSAFAGDAPTSIDPAFGGFVFPAESVVKLNALINRIGPPATSPAIAPTAAPAPAPTQSAPERPRPAAARPAPQEPQRQEPPRPKRISFYEWCEAEFRGDPHAVVQRYASEIARVAEDAGIRADDATAAIYFNGPGDKAPSIKCRPLERKDNGSVKMFPFYSMKRDINGNQFLSVTVNFSNLGSHRGVKFAFDSYDLMQQDYQVAKDTMSVDEVAANRDAERAAQQKAREAREAAALEKRDQELQQRRRSLVNWQNQFAKLDPVSGSDYLKDKKLDQIETTKRSGDVPAVDIRAGVDPDLGPYLIAPMVDTTGAFRGAQQIFSRAWEDGDNKFRNKKTVFGTQILDDNEQPTGCHIQCGDLVDGDPIFVAEGLADISATYLASGGVSAAATTGTSNLPYVVSSLRAAYPNSRIILVCDNDCYDPSKGNPGVFASLKTAFDYQVDYVIPTFEGLDTSSAPTDISDLWLLGGQEIASERLQNIRSAPVDLTTYAIMSTKLVGLKKLVAHINSQCEAIASADGPTVSIDSARQILIEAAASVYPRDGLLAELSENDQKILARIEEVREAVKKPAATEQPGANQKPPEAPRSAYPVTVNVTTGDSGKKRTEIRYAGEDPQVVQKIEATLDRISPSRIPYNKATERWYMPAAVNKIVASSLYDLTGAPPLYIGKTRGALYVMGDFSNDELKQQASDLIRYANITFVNSVGGFRINHEPEVEYIKGSLGALLRAGEPSPLQNVEEQGPESTVEVDPDVTAAAQVFDVGPSEIHRTALSLSCSAQAGIYTPEDFAFYAAYAKAFQRTQSFAEDKLQHHTLALEETRRIIDTKLGMEVHRRRLGPIATSRVKNVIKHLGLYDELMADDQNPVAERAVLSTAAKFQINEQDCADLIASVIGGSRELAGSLRNRHATLGTPAGTLRLKGSGISEHVEVLTIMDAGRFVSGPEPYRESSVAELAKEATTDAIDGVWYPKEDVTAISRKNATIVAMSADHVEAAARAGVKLAVWTNPYSHARGAGLKASDIASYFRRSAVQSIDSGRVITASGDAYVALFKDAKAIDDDLPLDRNAEERIDSFIALVGFGVDNMYDAEEVHDTFVLSTESPYYSSAEKSEISPLFRKDMTYANASLRYPAFRKVTTVGQIYDLIEAHASEIRVQKLREYINYYLSAAQGTTGRTFKSFRKFWRDPAVRGYLPEDAPENPYDSGDWSLNETIRNDLQRHTDIADGSLIKFFDSIVDETEAPALMNDFFAEPEPEAGPGNGMEAEADALPGHTTADNEPASAEVVETVSDEIGRTVSLIAHYHNDRVLYENRFERSLAGGAKETLLQAYTMSVGSAEQIHTPLLRADIATARDLVGKLNTDIEMIDQVSSRYRRSFVAESTLPGEDPFYICIDILSAEDGEHIATDSVWINRNAALEHFGTIKAEMQMAAATAVKPAPQSPQKALAEFMASSIKQGLSPEAFQERVAEILKVDSNSSRVDRVTELYSTNLKKHNPSAYKALSSPGVEIDASMSNTDGLEDQQTRTEQLRTAIARYVDEEQPYSTFYDDVFRAEGPATESNPYFDASRGIIDKKAVMADLAGAGYPTLRDLYETEFLRAHDRRSDELSLSRQGGFIPSSIEQRAPLGVQFAALASVVDVDRYTPIEQDSFSSFIEETQSPIVFSPILAEDLAAVSGESLVEQYSPAEILLLADVHGIHAPGFAQNPDEEQAASAAHRIVNHWRARQTALSLAEKGLDTASHEAITDVLEGMGLSSGGTQDACRSRLRKNVSRLRDLAQIRSFELAYVAQCLRAEDAGKALTAGQLVDITRICEGSDEFMKVLQDNAMRSSEAREIDQLRSALSHTMNRRAEADIDLLVQEHGFTTHGVPAKSTNAFKDWSAGEIDHKKEIGNVYLVGSKTDITLDSLPNHVSYFATLGNKAIATPVPLDRRVVDALDLRPASESAVNALLTPFEQAMAKTGMVAFHSTRSSTVTAVTPGKAKRVMISEYSNGERTSTTSASSITAWLKQHGENVGIPVPGDALVSDFLADVAPSTPEIDAVQDMAARLENAPESAVEWFIEAATKIEGIEDITIRHADLESREIATHIADDLTNRVTVAAARDALGMAPDTDTNLEAVSDLVKDSLTRITGQGEPAAAPAESELPIYGMAPIDAIARIAGNNTLQKELEAQYLPDTDAKLAALQRSIIEGEYESQLHFIHEALVCQMAADGNQLAREVAKDYYPEAMPAAPEPSAPDANTPKDGDIIYAEIDMASVLGVFQTQPSGESVIDTSFSVGVTEQIPEEDIAVLFAKDGTPLFNTSFPEFQKKSASFRSPGAHYSICPATDDGAQAIKKLPIAEIRELCTYIGCDAEGDRKSLADRYSTHWIISDTFADIDPEDIASEYTPDELQAYAASVGLKDASAEAIQRWSKEAVQASMAHVQRLNYDRVQSVRNRYPALGTENGPSFTPIDLDSTPLAVLTSGAKPSVYAAMYDTLGDIVAAWNNGRSIRERGQAYSILASTTADPKSLATLSSALPPEVSIRPDIADGALTWAAFEGDQVIPGSGSSDPLMCLSQLRESGFDLLEDPAVQTLQAGQTITWIEHTEPLTLGTGVLPSDVVIRQSDIENDTTIQIERGVVVRLADIQVHDSNAGAARLAKEAAKFDGSSAEFERLLAVKAGDSVESGQGPKAVEFLLAQQEVATLIKEFTAASAASKRELEFAVVKGSFHLLDAEGERIGSLSSAADLLAAAKEPQGVALRPITPVAAPIHGPREDEEHTEQRAAKGLSM